MLDDAPIPSADAEVVTLEVDARPAAIPAMTVRSGETWRFEAEGEWKDWFVTCGPGGYRVALFEFLDIRPRLRSAPWFALVGEVAEAAETVVIGRGVEHTFRHSGPFVVCANDAPSMRWNNHGAVKLSARRLEAPTPREHRCPAVEDHSLGARWMRLRAAADKTAGFLFIGTLLLAIGLTLTMTPQGQDIITTVAQDGWKADGTAPALSPKLVWLCVATFVLGFEAWFWARAIVEYRFGARANWRRNWWLALTPRLFGAAPFGFLLCALLNSRQPVGLPGAVLALGGALFLAFLIWREPITRALEDLTGKLHRGGQPRAARALGLALISLKTWLLIAAMLAAFGCTIVVLASPVHPAQHIGPAAVVLLAAALVIPFMTPAIQMGSLRRIPVTPLLIGWALLLSFWVDNHAVRLAPDQPKPAARATLSESYAEWRAQAKPNLDGQIPLVLVASEGGASRAGFWTGDALAVLEDKSGGAFSRDLFAISSVSGGTLGAVGYLATLHDNRALTGAALRDAVDDFTGGDYLSPTLAGMFVPDLIQRFLFPAFLPDRAQSLERSWEVGWRDHCRHVAGRCHDPALLERRMLSLWPWPATAWTPMLIIGGAREEDGRRILTSSTNLGSAVDADDFHTVMKGRDMKGRDVRLSTAILNGARFPFISPGGTLQGAAPGFGGHIVDGGYFDAAGVEALRELAGAVMAQAASAPSARPATIQPIFIVLANADPKPGNNRPAEFAADAFGPLIGLYQSRHAHGDHLRLLLNQELPPQPATGHDTILKPRVVTIVACHDAPLDWALSEEARRGLRQSIDVDNSDRIANLAALVGGHAPNRFPDNNSDRCAPGA